MKRYFLNISMLVLTLLTFTACSNDDDNDDDKDGMTNTYAFFEPVMDWNSTEADVRNAMKGMVGWTEDVDSEEKNELVFANRRTGAEMRYYFERGRLHSSSVCYYDCPDAFERMKAEWATKLNLTWLKRDFFSTIFYEAKCPDRKCEVAAQLNNYSGMDYMIVEFTHTENL